MVKADLYRHLPTSDELPCSDDIPLDNDDQNLQQGQFWAYHDALFANQARLGSDLYPEIAQELGLDMEQFERDGQRPT